VSESGGREFDALAAIAAILFGGQAEFFDLTEKDVACPPEHYLCGCPEANA
jgi:hypothetical protein